MQRYGEPGPCAGAGPLPETDGMNKHRPAPLMRRIIVLSVVIAGVWGLSELARPNANPAVAPTSDQSLNSGLPVDHFRLMFP